MFTFETPELSYSERIMFRIRDKSIRLFFVAKILVVTIILLSFQFFTGAFFSFLFLCGLLLPYFMGCSTYITEWKVFHDNIIIKYLDFNASKTIEIPKEDLKVEFEPGSGISPSRMHLTNKVNGKTILIQYEIGRWFVENMKVLEGEYR